MTITTDQLTQFRALLKNEEKSAATLNKYLRDIQRFALWLGDTPLERDAMLDYKADLMRHYAAGSVNSILAALNRFLRMIAREDCRVHRLRIQYQAYSPEEREITAQEYADLVRTARETGRARLAGVRGRQPCRRTGDDAPPALARPPPPRLCRRDPACRPFH